MTLIQDSSHGHCPLDVTLHGKNTLTAFCFQMAFHLCILQAVCQPFKWLGHLFARNFRWFKWLCHPFLGNINPFEWLSDQFVKRHQTIWMTWSPIRWRHQANRMTWSPVCWRHQAVRMAWSSILWHPFEFSVKWHGRWVTLNFTCLSGELNVFQHWFDYICKSLGALNSYFALLKQHSYTSDVGVDVFFFSDVADYELLSIDDP